MIIPPLHRQAGKEKENDLLSKIHDEKEAVLLESELT
jgi:hypothetical protein